MSILKNARPKSLLVGLVAIVHTSVLALPMLAFAQETAPTDTATTTSQTEEVVPDPTPETTAPAPATTSPAPVVPENTGPKAPTGPEKSQFVLNPETGLWENDYYTWNPKTKQSAPKNAPDYSYNPETGRWDTTEWVYSPESGKYVPNKKSVAAPPAGTPAAAVVPLAQPLTSTAAPTDLNKTASLLSAPLAVAASSQKPNENVTIDFDNENDGFFDLYFNANISTTHSSVATSGDASVLQNTTGGDATTGDALAALNLLNMIQSAWGWNGFQPNLYTANIQGDYYGDIEINPALMASADPCGCGDITINAEINAAIHNDVNLLAQSGNATVSGNTTGGNATSGDATAVANIINMINSSIASGQSFLGVLNIHGDFEGDVLVPKNLIEQLLAANVPSTQMNFSDTDIELDDNQTIENNITAAASSGDALVTNNTTAGSATSGSAETSVTIFNLTGRQVIGSNAFLVFVNVSGEWVGFITDAPEGATAALLGSSDTQNHCGACGGDLDAEIDSNISIINDVNVAAHTGNAEVSYNTTGGDATSGDAYAATNISNITNSSFSLSGIFSLLFINIFGDWLGSFGTDTAYGDPKVPKQAVVSPLQKNVLGASSPKRSKPAATISNTAPSSKVKAYFVNFGAGSGSADGQDSLTISSASEIEPPSAPQSESLVTSESATTAHNGMPAITMISLILGAYLIIFHGKALILRPASRVFGSWLG